MQIQPFRPIPFQIVLAPATVKNLQLQLSLGEIVSGKVLRVFSENSALLNIKGARVLVETPTKLEPGQILNLKVIDFSSKLILQKLEPEQILTENALSYLRQSFGEVLSLGKDLLNLTSVNSSLISLLKENFINLLPLAEQLEALINLISFQPSDIKDPSFRSLLNFLNQSGLFYEANLWQWFLAGAKKSDKNFWSEDLKGVLLKILEQIKILPESLQKSEYLSKWTENIKQALKSLELLQLLNFVNLTSEEGYYFQIPTNTTGFGSTIHLKIQPELEQEKKAAQGKKSSLFRFVIGVELSALGEIRADFWWAEPPHRQELEAPSSKKEDPKEIKPSSEKSLLMPAVRILTGHFFVQSKEIQTFVEENLDLLQQKLQSVGFQVENLSCSVSSTPLAEEFNFPKGLLPEKVRSLDLKV